MNHPPVSSQNKVGLKYMKVNGVGKISVEPNIAEIQVGVVTKDTNVTQAQQANSQVINKIIDSLASLQVSGNNIQTADYFIIPQYDYEDGTSIFTGYQVTHMLSIIIENLRFVGEVIDTAVQQGANRVSNINFKVKDEQFYYQQALTKALENGVAKAQTMARTMRLNLDYYPISIKEELVNKDQTPMPFVSAEVAGVSTPIEPGRLEVTARVEMKFSYTP
ncbi:SIMPL domain-containing protein [Aquibacillus koreensis]|uniref:SIMPL domain-containing protein n=1 Tax=Aquibacillus koreensis TaxID=279446 RepID=A0A9X4AL50_9BACI|nr:SIMPL domain-containing protein [Aquibacillus koreensis]MCT2536125.1 SIMPL domain-containing protein [Aquibacillus koreensis]MDC3422050.1 SIMPL domain-containing protein [Aquibacillus koreensis]